MRSTLSIAELSTRIMHGMVVLLAWPAVAHADVVFTQPDKTQQNLPDLQGARNEPGYFSLAEQSAALGYVSRRQKWEATLDQYLRPSASLSFDYGLQLTNNFGAGGTFTRQDEQSEVVVNGIFAPKRNVRFRVAGAQLRSDAGHAAASPDGIVQNSYLLGARKYWNKYELLSDLGISTYAVEASAPTSLSSLASADALEAANPRLLAPGRQDGYMLNLNLRPSASSNLELRHEQSQSTYRFDVGNQRTDSLASNRVRYSHYLDHCMRVHGSYSAGRDSDRVELQLAQNNWQLQLSRQQEGADSDTAIQIGYTLPLGRTKYQRQNCGPTLQSTPSFEPIVDAATTRPQQFPREPLVVIDTP